MYITGLLCTCQMLSEIPPDHTLKAKWRQLFLRIPKCCILKWGLIPGKKSSVIYERSSFLLLYGFVLLKRIFEIELMFMAPKKKRPNLIQKVGACSSLLNNVG